MSVTQSLNSIVDITVTFAPVSAAAPLFNQTCILGTSVHIPTYGANSRIRQYTSTAGMTADGFLSTDPEFLEAEQYFGQTPAPQLLWIARQDVTAILTLIPHASAAGTLYHVGDIVTIVQSGATFGTALITAVATGGIPTALTALVQGTNYTVAAGLSTTGGSGSGLEVDITAIGETPLQGAIAARNGSSSWYILCVLAATDLNDIVAIGGYIESASPPSQFFYNTTDLTGAAIQALQALAYERSLNITGTTQGGAYPNNLYAASALAGRMMGLNSGLPGSYFTMMFKGLTGIAAEPLSTSQIGIIQGFNGNILLNYDDTYTWVQKGTMASGAFFDQILGVDMLVADLLVSLTDVLVDQNAVPLNDPGETLFINAANAACQRAVTIGFIGPGVWNGVPLLNLKTGQALPAGFLVQAQSYSQQSPQNQAARIAMPLVIAIILGEAAQSLSIGITVQR